MPKFLTIGKCHGVGCEERATHETLIGSQICDRHFSLFYSDEPCPLDGAALGLRLPLTWGAYCRDFVRRASSLLSRAFWQRLPGRARWHVWLFWHRIWWPIQWHVPSLTGRVFGRKSCSHCDRYIVSVIDKRGIYICDDCREQHFDKVSAGYGGDFGRNQACVTCGEPADCEIEQQPYCQPHGHFARTGEVYEPPSEEERVRMSALFDAMVSLDQVDQGPPTVRTSRFTGVTMDGPYLGRLFDLAQRLYDERKRPH